MLRRWRTLLVVPLLFAVLPAWAQAVWLPAAPGGGYVHQVVLDPTSPSTLYAAAWGGVYRSDDGGATWSWRSGGLDGLDAVALAFDPGTFPPRLYALTWQPRRLHASDDGGATWRPVFEVTEGVGDPALEVGADGTVYLLSWRLYVGHDRGSRWQVAPIGDPDAGFLLRQVAAHPNVPGRVAARSDETLWQSDDGGESWVRLATPAPPVAFAFAPSEPEVEYLSAGGLFDFDTWRSSDRGASWQFRGDLAWSQLTVDPFDADVLHNFAGNWTRISRDAGATWELTFLPLALTTATADPKRPDRWWAGSEVQGVAMSEDGGATWRRGSQDGLTANRFAYLDFDELGHLYAGWTGYSAASNLRRDDDGWRVLPLTPPVAPLYTVAAAPHRPWVIYAGGLSGLAVSRDDGVTWRQLDTGDPEAPLAPVNGLHVPARGPLVAAGFGIHWSEDGGESWQRSFPSSVVLGGDLWEIDVVDLVSDRERQNVLYAAVTYRFPNRPVGAPPAPVIFRSLDGGKSWRRFVAGSTVLALAPSLPRTLYVAFGEVVLTSDDGGLRWRVAGVAGGEVRDLEVDPRDPRTVFAATAGAGVQWSRDGGATWEPLASGLAEQGRLEVDRVRIDPLDPDRLYALPRLGGLFELRK